MPADHLHLPPCQMVEKTRSMCMPAADMYIKLQDCELLATDCIDGCVVPCKVSAFATPVSEADASRMVRYLEVFKVIPKLPF